MSTPPQTRPRFVPDEPFPPYTYVPGRSPHPVSDPAGHSHGAHRPPPEPLEAAQWRSCRPYLYGVDLFNHGYYWEAHEVWEGLWNAAGREGVTADFLKGLIQLAAAGVKVRQGLVTGVERHGRRAAELFRQVGRAVGGTYLGFAPAALARWADEAAHATICEDAAVDAVAPLFPFVLTPA